MEVTEFMQSKLHPRPLQRARARYEARTGNTPWEKRHTAGADHHHSDLSQGSQVVQAQDPDPSSFEYLLKTYQNRERDRSHLRESSVLSAWEQERVYLFCEQCNNKLTDSDWLKFKSEGRDVENVTHCSPCVELMAEALALSSRPHEFTDVE